MLNILVGQQLQTSANYSTVFYDNSMSYRIVGGDGLTKLSYDLGYLVQGASAPELNWNEVYNLQVDGTLSDLYESDYEHDYPDGSTNQVFGGWVRDGITYVPIDVVTIVVRRNSSSMSVGAICAKERNGQLRRCHYTIDVKTSKVTTGIYKGKYQTAYYRSRSNGCQLNPNPPVVYTDEKSSGYKEFLSSYMQQLRWLAPSATAGIVNLTKTQTFDMRMSPRRLLDLVRHDVVLFKHRVIEEHTNMLYESHASAFDGLQKFDGNLLVLATKLGTMGTTTLSSVKEFLDSSQTIKDAASLWLANRYGDRLSISGFKSLTESVARELGSYLGGTTRYVETGSRGSSSYNDEFISFTYSYATRLAVKPNDANKLMKSIRYAYEWDLYPSLGNVWDAIPLSFVVDWFANIGDIWSDVDRMVQSRYYDIHLISDSVKAVGQSPRVGGVTLSYYQRTFSKNLMLGVDSVKLGLPSAINVIDGAALVIGFT